MRTGTTICTNSPVGESECNGRAENVVRRVGVKFRTPKANLEHKTGDKTGNKAAITRWMARWAGEVLTRYTVGADDETALEQRRGSNCAKDVVTSGEEVVHLPPSDSQCPQQGRTSDV